MTVSEHVSHRAVSPLDATFLELEQADVTAHMHIGGVLVFDPLARRRHAELGGSRGTSGAPRRHCRATGSGSRAAHRRPVLAGWEPDEQFDIAAHVHRAALPAPGGERELLDWAADFWSHRLDRGPAAVGDGPARGARRRSLGALSKTHHCLVDGVGSVDAGTVLLDAEPKPARRKATPRTPPVQPPHESGALRRLAGLSVTAAGAAVDAAVRHPRHAAQGLDPARALRRTARARRTRRRAEHQRQRPAQRASPARGDGGPAGARRGDEFVAHEQFDERAGGVEALCGVPGMAHGVDRRSRCGHRQTGQAPQRPGLVGRLDRGVRGVALRRAGLGSASSNTVPASTEPTPPTRQ